ncbi:MAG TPA: NEW3 domain-containing protein, partial [Candidatus Glassbacteria bacterium]|nr:NEW3 domain-containing protein [Candidatus Glassbacteria bacterium]
LYDFGPEPEDRSSRPSSQSETSLRPWRKVSEHLYHYRPTGYILLSADSTALFYDYYAVEGRSDQRYGYDSVNEVIKALGIKAVEVVIPSHFHEDHLRGFPSLKESFGTQFWVYENMADILAHPDRYNLCCLAPEIIPADRILHDNERIRWKEYEFTVMHFPGQTMYHQAMAGNVDGQKVMFMGDTDCYELDDPNLSRRNLRLHGISTFLNYYLLEPGEGYEKILQRVIEFNPQVLLFAHSGPRPGDMEMFVKNQEMLRKRIARVAAVLPFDDPNIGFDPNWAHFYPYTVKASPGGSFPAEVRVRNHLAAPSQARVELRLPAGWRAEPASAELRVAGKGENLARFTLTVPKGAKTGGRKIVTARIITDGHDWGEFCEMLVGVE